MLKSLTGLACAALVALAAALPASAAEAELEGSILWKSWKPVQAEGDALAKAFMAAHPKVHVTFVWQTPSDYWPALKLSLAAGDAPDLWFISPGALYREDQPFAEDLQPFAERQWGAGWADRWTPAPLAAARLGGAVKGLPFVDLGAGTLWYEKGLFDRLGLAPPQTLDQWRSVDARLKAAGVTPFAQGASEDWINQDHFLAIAAQLAPGKVYAADAGTLPWTDPALVRAMTFWKSLFDEGLIDAGALAMTQYPEAQDLFASGKAGMIMQGTWNNEGMTRAGMDAYRKAYGLDRDLDFVPFAYPDIDGDGKTGPMTVGADALVMMSKDSRSKDAAWAFIAFLMEEAGQRFVAGKLNIPAVKAFEADPAAALTEAERGGLALERRLLAETTQPRELNEPETTKALGVALQQVASGQATPEAALADVEAVARRVHHKPD
jgi:raffinose/stachyose/melibiose transport system substrate-binding protein